MIANRMTTAPSYVMPAFTRDQKLFPFPVTYLPNGWGVSVPNIGPELAEVMLELNAEDVQRNPRPANIAKFARDMETGEWRLTHQGVAFNRAGLLMDGQNRMAAVIASGAVVKMLVFFGAGAAEEMSALDLGGTRTATDSAHSLGLDVDRYDVSVIRQMCQTGGAMAQRFTHAEIIRLLNKYSTSVIWTNARFTNSGGLGLTPVRAAVARAYYHCDPDRLDRFVKIYLNEIGRDNGSAVENVPVILSRYVQASDGVRKAAQTAEIRGKALRAIEAFMNNEPIGKLQHSPLNNTIFPLPLDPTANGAA